ncbi:MAG: cytochrome b [Gammaproteobacteria bacterium]|nr:MAG: cytochrome b [Gammaproteobacteria bacterium]
MTNNATRYDRVQVVLHWLIAVIILFMIGLGLYMIELPKQSELPPGEESVRAFYFLLHKSMGITVAMLIVLRVVWRLTHKAPPLPDTVSKWQQKAAGAVHVLLYFVMIAMPISGFMQSMFSKYDTKFWGIVLPRIADADDAMRESFSQIHECLAFFFIGLIVIHLVAAIKHRFSGTEITDRMTFRK